MIEYETEIFIDRFVEILKRGLVKDLVSINAYFNNFC